MTTIAKAVAVLANITASGISMLQQAMVISQLIQTANAEGRSTFTEEEWAQITGADDAARKALDDAIKAHGG